MAKFKLKRGSLEVTCDVSEIVSLTEAGHGIAVTFKGGAHLVFDQPVPLATRKVLTSINLSSGNDILVDLLAADKPIQIFPSK